MLGYSQTDYQVALIRHEEIKRKAERLGPVLAELRERESRSGQSVLARLRAFGVDKLGTGRARIAVSHRIQKLAES